MTLVHRTLKYTDLGLTAVALLLSALTLYTWATLSGPRTMAYAMALTVVTVAVWLVEAGVSWARNRED